MYIRIPFNVNKTINTVNNTGSTKNNAQFVPIYMYVNKLGIK